MLLSRLGDQDFVKVLDFGLAKVFSAANAVKTAAGVLLGTPQYMSPEACESKRDIDHRTDIYALGVLLFQMMTGVLPFDGETMGEVLVKQVTTLPPAPRAMNPAIPPSVEQILLRCLAKPVDARFATMMELRAALLDPESYLRGSPPIAPARSVTSAFVLGEASTVAMQAAPDPGPLPAALQRTRIGTGALPLPAPLPSLSGAASAPTMIAGHPPLRRPTAGMAVPPQPQELKMNTMRIATPMGYSSRPPRKVWPAVLGMAVLLGVAGGIVSVTCFGHDAAPRPGAAELRAPAGGGSGDAPAAAVASAAAGATGSATVAGAGVVSDPRTVPAGSATAGQGTAGVAGRGATGAVGAVAAPVTAATVAASTTDAAATAATAAASGAGAGSARPAAAAARTAHLTIESVPVGATVRGPDGTALGKTPLALDWPASDAPVRFELRLAGYKMKPKQTVINGNTRLVIELERAPVRRGAAQKSSGSNNGLMRPDD